MSLPKYVFPDRTPSGTIRYRFRKPGLPKCRILGEPGSPQFEEAYRLALEAKPAPKQAAAVKRTVPGTIDQLVVTYYQSVEYASLRQTTKINRRSKIEHFRNLHGTKPIADLDSKHFALLLAPMSPVMKKDWLYTIRALYRVAMPLGIAAFDPTAGYKRPKIQTTSYYTWTEDDIALFQDTHPIGSTARLALELLLNTGARRWDIVELGPKNVRREHNQERIKWTSHKRNVPINLPFPDRLRPILQATVTGINTFIVNDRGGPFTPGSFSQAMRRWCNESGLPECKTHGLRHAVGRRLAENGATIDEIMAVLGHATPAQSLVYTREANKGKLADNAMRKLWG